jgi:nucleoid DNA-binding protein
MKQMINKNTLAKELAERLGITDDLAKRFLRMYHEMVIENIRKGTSVKMQYFGVYTPAVRSGGPVRNPATGERLTVESKNTFRFHPSVYAVKKLNGEI